MFKELMEYIQNNRAPKIECLHVPGKGDRSEDVADILLIPSGMSAQGVKPFLDAYLKKPERRKGVATVYDIESFVTLTNRFKDVNSAIFKKSEYRDNSFSAGLKAILNYNPDEADNSKADNRDHVVQYNFPITIELKTWLEANGNPMSTKDFAVFLEDNIADLVIADNDHFHTRFGENGVPAFATPSKIMELSRGIEVRVDQKVTQAYRVSDGSFAMQFTSENNDVTGQPLKLPEWFCLGIPVFENGAFVQIPVRLRFRVSGGQVNWHFELYRAGDVFKRVFEDACEKVGTDTALPIFNGSPE